MLCKPTKATIHGISCLWNILAKAAVVESLLNAAELMQWPNKQSFISIKSMLSSGSSQKVYWPKNSLIHRIIISVSVDDSETNL